MTIEFHTPQKGITEKLIRHIRGEIMEMVHADDKIGRAEVTIKKDELVKSPDNQSCEIRLDIPGDTIMVHRRTTDFEDSVNEVIRELKKLLKERRRESRLPPDTTTSTVNV